MGSPRSVNFLSQRTAEALPGDASVYLISITDGLPAQVSGHWAGLLRLSFHDVEPEWAMPGQRLMDVGQAEAIARLANEAAGVDADIIVHCQAGISRSGAVAFALCEHWRLPFDGEHKECNTHVLNRTRAALARFSPKSTNDPPC